VKYGSEERLGSGRYGRSGRYGTPVQAAAALGVVALTGGAVWLLFNANDAVAVAAPEPTSQSAAAECAALTKAVPQTVDNQSRRSTNPNSPLTAAWGNPPITLRCAVPEPDILRPGSKTYDPTAMEAYVDGIAWLQEKTGDGYRFTAAQRAVYVEVDVPSAYNSQEPNPLIDLGAAVVKVIPRNDGGSGNDIAPAATSTASANSTAGATTTATAIPTPSATSTH
jgi:hypothetical protein